MHSHPSTVRVRARPRLAALAASAAALAGTLALAPAAQAQDAPSGARLSATYSKHVLVGNLAKVRGSLSSGEGGRAVLVQIRSRGRWSTVDRTRTTGGGAYSGAWRPRSPGTLPLRVRLAEVDTSRTGSANASATPATGTVMAYRATRASWYGPGFYGRRLACGGRLRPGQIGVANKRLPCGTRVTFRYRGRSVVAPVIDRGPYVGGREWDLTAATRAKLRFPSTGVVWSNR